jgi:hypothetical protein
MSVRNPSQTPVREIGIRSHLSLVQTAVPPLVGHLQGVYPPGPGFARALAAGLNSGPDAAARVGMHRSCFYRRRVAAAGPSCPLF